ncbi:MAG: hypothetical protein QW727_02765 [Candidatus Pacearchaeota archaeon]
MKLGVIIVIVVISVGIITAYTTFLYYPKCKDIECWNSKLKKCSKAIFINEPRDITWEYTILGKKTISDQKKCVVKTKVIDIRRGLKKTEILEGKEMICSLPFGAIILPEANPNFCTGKLKEEMQGLIIQKLHEYILQNIGKLTKESTEIEGVGSFNIETNE